MIAVDYRTPELEQESNSRIQDLLEKWHQEHVTSQLYDIDGLL